MCNILNHFIMKKTVLYCGAALVGMAMLQSCTQDELMNTNNNGGPQEMTFTAGTPSSRTTLANGTTVNWVKEDAISIFSGSENNKFTTAAGGTSVATFTGVATPSESYTALYPYNEDALFAGSTITTNLPSEQVAGVWTFDPKANISVATTTNNSLVFSNTCGLIKFQNSIASGLTKITLTSPDVNIAGSVSIKDGILSVNESGSKTITLTALEGTFVGPTAENSNPKEYNMVVPPVAFSKGFTLTLTVDGTDRTYDFTPTADQPLSIVAGKVVTIKLSDDKEPEVSETAEVAVSGATEIVSDPTTGSDRIELTLAQTVEGTASNMDAFKVMVGTTQIPVTAAVASGNKMTLTLGTTIYNDDYNINVTYNESGAVNDFTTTTDGKTASIKIISQDVTLKHETEWKLDFSGIASAGDFFVGLDALEGKCTIENGNLVVAPNAGRFAITKNFKFHSKANYTFTCEYASNPDNALTVRFADSPVDIFKVWIGKNNTEAGSESDKNKINDDGSWSMEKQGDKTAAVPEFGVFSVDNLGGAVVKSITLVEYEKNPSTPVQEDQEYEATHGNYTNDNTNWN